MARSNDAATFIASLRGTVEAAIRNALEKQSVPGAELAAKQGARDVILALIYEWGGDQIYIPLKSDELDEAIFDEMTSGVRASVLASKYRIAKSTVYKIYHAERARRESPKQGLLPGV